MNRYQNSIIWLGLILVVLNVIVNIGTFKSVLFGSTGGNTGGKPSVPPKSGGSTVNPPIAPGQLPVQPQPTPPGSMIV